MIDANIDIVIDEGKKLLTSINQQLTLSNLISLYGKDSKIVSDYIEKNKLLR